MGWTVVLTVHIVGAVVWWWLMPGGFPLDHPRFWVNRVLPPVVIFVAMAARIRLGNARWLVSFRNAIPAALATLWITAALAAVIVFPDSFRWKYLLPLLVGAFCFIVWMRDRRQKRSTWPQISWILLPVAFLTGASLPVSQRAPPGGTHPIGSQRPVPGAVIARGRGNLTLPNGASIDPAGASIRFTRGRVVLSVEPLMRIESRSPDGCWTLLAPRNSIQETRRALRGTRTSANNAYEISYSGDGNASLGVRPDSVPGRTLISANTQISRTYSHLNTYTELTLAGHGKLFLRFSPCPDVPIEVTPQDYPFGRPARFAFLDDQGRFHVVEASNAEKGPFTDLASGPLARGSPLWIEMLDGTTPLFKIEFADWSQECSTQLSPTAGWGVPENSIEFSRQSDNPASTVSIFLTLAATSVGRGYDTVELNAGSYRNLMWVQQYDPPASLPTTAPSPESGPQGTPRSSPQR